MKTRKFATILAVGAFAAATGSPSLIAQTEVPPPLDNVAPAPAATTETVDDSTKSAADSALKNFRAPEADPAPAPAPTPEAQEREPAPVPAAEDPIIPSAPTQAEIEAAKIQAAQMGVSQETIGRAEEAVQDATEKVQGMSEAEVEDAMKALEALGAQAKKALEEAQVVPDDAVEGTAQDVAVSAAPEEGMSLMPESLPSEIPADAAARASEVVRELGSDPAALAALDAKRNEIVGRIMAESDAKKAKLTFRRAFTAATSSPEAMSLKEASNMAATDAEKREILRQYYAVVFADVRKRAPGIKTFADEREEEYLRTIDRQSPPDEAISLSTPAKPEKEAKEEDNSILSM